MAEIRPFRGVHYDQSMVGDLSAVICPPYDVITPQIGSELYHRSEYNFVRVEAARPLPQDTVTDNKYTRSATTLERWLEEGILKVDEVPAIYLHDHYFVYQGKEYRRRGIIVCVRLEEWDRRVVRPHEGTLAEPRSDRLSLMWACQANTSPILALFDDRGQRVSSLLAGHERSKPIISLSNDEGESHYLWAIVEPEIINQIYETLAHQPLYIADGHHRYESALAYQRERHACSSSVSADAAFNFVLMELVDTSDPGLIILPPHRLVRGLSKSTLNGLMTKLKSFFEVEELPLDTSNAWGQIDDLLARETEQVRLGLFGLVSRCFLLLELRDFTATSQMMPYFHSELYKKLDVSIIDHIILEKLLGLDLDKEEAMLTYDYSKQSVINRILDQEYQLAFLLNPIRVEVIKAIADVDDRMPRKSTYFYPKPPAGLILHRLF